MTWCLMYDLQISSFTTEVSFWVVFTHKMLFGCKVALEAKLVNQNGVFSHLNGIKINK